MAKFWKILETLGIDLFEIIKNPEHPISFLVDETGAFNAEVAMPLN